MDKLLQIWYSSGVYQVQPGQVIMMAVGLLLLYLAINHDGCGLVTALFSH